MDKRWLYETLQQLKTFVAAKQTSVVEALEYSISSFFLLLCSLQLVHR